MSFQQGLSGLNTAAKNLDVIGNNVANSGTVGFKRAQAQFADVYANSLSGAGGAQIGIGTNMAAIVQQFAQGNISVTDNPLDVAINGGGFFRLSKDGAITYSRSGQFHLDKDGYLVNPTGSRVTGYAAMPGGTLNTGSPVDLHIATGDMPPRVTSQVGALLNLDSRNTALPSAGFNLSNPATYHHSTSVSVYDSLGNPHLLSTYYMKTAPGSWDVFASLDGTQIGAGPVGAINFLGDGQVDTTTTTMPFTLNAPVLTGAISPMTFTLDFTGTTQYGASFSLNALRQDGFASGRLSGFNINPDGVVQGRYTNDQSVALGQIVLVNFANPQGLAALGDNAFGQSSTSGEPLIGVAGTGSLGVLQSSATEDSNVDLTAELVNLITAQRVYQANAQTIKSQDQVMQTLVNLR